MSTAAVERAPTQKEAQDGYNPSSSGEHFNAMSKDYDHDYRLRKRGLAHVMEYKRFDPERVGLSKKFNLFSHAQLHGSGAKPPRGELLALLGGVGSEEHIGGDTAIVKSNLYDPFLLVSTVDYSYSPVEDPYMNGWIAAVNMASDIYATGLEYVDNVLMSLAASSEMDERDRFIVTKLMMLGFDHAVKRELDSVVTGGQSVMNPWPLLGGIAKTICKEEDIVRADQAEVGDLIVLTKPLGTSLTTDALSLSKSKDAEKAKSHGLTDAELDRAVRVSEMSMARSNVTAARLMHKYKSHGATDVSGYGPVGELAKVAEQSKNNVDLLIHSLPVIKEALKANKALNGKILAGLHAETSGGLLVILPKENAQKFIDEISATDEWPAWIVGEVKAGTKKAVLSTNPKIIEV